MYDVAKHDVRPHGTYILHCTRQVKLIESSDIIGKKSIFNHGILNRVNLQQPHRFLCKIIQIIAMQRLQIQIIAYF